MARQNSLFGKAQRRQARSRKRLDPSAPVDLLGTVELLHKYLDASLCETVFKKVRTSERQREWTLQKLADFWTEVILRAPPALTQALQEAAGGVAGWPQVQTSEQAFFQRCKNFNWKFFATLFDGFGKRILRVAPCSYADDLRHLRDQFRELWILDGSRLDAIAHRLKILWDVRSPILPGCLLAAYDLFRGIPRRLQFEPDAACSEMKRVFRMLDEIPRGTLLLGDRLYGSVALFQKMASRGLWGVFRLNSTLKVRRIRRLSRTRGQGGILEDWLVEVGSGQTAPKQTLRLIRFTTRKVRYELLTNVLNPKKLSPQDAMNLYPHRWSVERLFFDLKEVLNLNRFYAANPNAVAMQVYAAGIVYTAMRGAQALTAKKLGITPEEISPQKFFVRMAAASAMWVGVQIGFTLMRRANPGRRLKTPRIRGQPFVTTTVGAILVEKRSEDRRKRRFCKGRTRWKSFKHIPGGKKLLKKLS